MQNSTLDLNGSDTGVISAIGQDSTIGGLTGSRNLDMLTRTLSIGNNNARTTYSGVLSNGGLAKTGSGTLTALGQQHLRGTTTLSTGTINLGDHETRRSPAAGQQHGRGAIALNGGYLQYSAANQYDYSGRLAQPPISSTTSIPTA